jgi:hypothetical protein
MPVYYQPWPPISNRSMFLPGTEVLPEKEMRVTFLGSSPWPPNELPKGTSMLVELGNGTMQPRRFFFDLGISDGAAPASMDPRWFVSSGKGLPESIEFPTPRNLRENLQEQFVRDLELDPALYYPPDAYRPQTQTWPGITINPREMLAQRGIELDPDWVKP